MEGTGGYAVRLFSVIVVDDEESVRSGLSDLVDWNDFGFALVGSFEDGDSAIDYLSSHNVDVVLTDIVMARRSGIDIAKYAAAFRPEMEVVILSGHDDFAYAQQAMEFRVRHYLLKPTDIGELRKIFLAIHNDLDKKFEENSSSLAQRTSLRNMQTILRSEMLERLAEDQDTAENILAHKFVAAGLPQDYPNRPCTVVTIRFQDPERFRGDDATFNRALNFLSEPSQGMVLVPLVGGDSIRIIASQDNTVAIQEFESAVALRIGERAIKLHELMGISVCFLETASFGTVLEWLGKRGGPHPPQNSSMRKILNLALHAMEAASPQDINIEAVAAKAHISPSYLSRLFKKEMNTTFSSYARNIRIERAMLLLADPDLTIDTISFEVGYQSTKHFYRVFREIRGVTPATYRAGLAKKQR